MEVPDSLRVSSKRGKHNHEANLGVVLKELKEGTPQGGVTLQQLVSVCGVSKRHIYRYLKELEEMGVPIERPYVIQPGKSGAGRYKLKEDQTHEVMGETLLLAALNQMLERCCTYHHLLIFLKEFIILSMAIRYGFKLPLHSIVKM